jgi:hypothetical protein
MIADASCKSFLKRYFILNIVAYIFSEFKKEKAQLANVNT